MTSRPLSSHSGGPGARSDEAPRLSLLELDSWKATDAPFRCATFARCLSAEIGEQILSWLETDAPWSLTQTDFYEQHEFSCWDSPAPIATWLTSDTVLTGVRNTMTAIFDTDYDNDVNVVFHRLIPPQRIGIHNDLAGEETHRLIIQLNRGMADGDGGVLMLFNSDNPADIHKLLRPVNLSGFAFEISAASHHAVSQVHGGARYTLIYSLRATRSNDTT